MQTLKHKSIKAFKWTISEQVLSQGLSFVTNIIMVRLLTPSDFGLFVIPLFVINFIRDIQDFEFSSLIIQTKSIGKEKTNSIFWFNAFVGLFFFLLIQLFILFYSNYFAVNESIEVFNYLSYSVIIYSFYFTTDALLRRELLFKKLFYINVISVLLSCIAGIYFSIVLKNYHALVIKQLTYVLSLTILCFVFSEWKPNFIFKYKNIKDNLHFTMPLFGSKLGNFIARNIDSMLISQYMGSVALGLYDRSYRLLTLPLSQVTNAFSKVIFPTFSIMNNSKQSLSSTYLLICRLISFVTFPMMLGLLSVSDIFVSSLFGEQWLEIIPIIKVFCIISIFQSINSIGTNIFLAQGLTKKLFKLNVILQSILILAIVLSIYFYRDLFILAIAYSIASFICIIPFTYYTGKILNLSLLEISKNLTPNLLLSIMMAFSVYFLKEYLLQYYGGFSVLIICIFVGILIFTGLAYLTKNKSLKDSIRLILRSTDLV